MLTQQPDIISRYVDSGQVKIVFWPVLNHGNPSLYSSITFHCVGEQNAALAWQVHHLMFENQGQVWQATRDDFIRFATEVGADADLFGQCYDSEAALNTVLSQDNIRTERGIRGQPYFDVNGIVLAGTAQLEETIAQQLEQ